VEVSKGTTRDSPVDEKERWEGIKGVLEKRGGRNSARDKEYSELILKACPKGVLPQVDNTAYILTTEQLEKKREDKGGSVTA